MIPQKKMKNPGRRSPMRVVQHLDLSDAADIAGGAAGTAILPGVGTAVGASLGHIIANLFSGGDKTWDKAGPGVHDWFTSTGPEEFLQWMKTNHADKFGNLETVKGMFALWLWQTDRSIIGDDPADLANFSPNGQVSGLQTVYAAMGIDYAATVAKINSNPIGWHGHVGDSEVVMLPGGGTPSVPSSAVDNLKDAASRIAGGTGTPADHSLMGVLNAAAHDIAQSAASGLNASGGITVGLPQEQLHDLLKSLIPWILGGLALLVVIIMVSRRTPAKA